MGNIDGKGTNIRVDSLSLLDSGKSRRVISTIDQGYTDFGSDLIADAHGNMLPFFALFFCEKNANWTRRRIVLPIGLEPLVSSNWPFAAVEFLSF